MCVCVRDVREHVCAVYVPCDDPYHLHDPLPITFLAIQLLVNNIKLGVMALSQTKLKLVI